VRPGLLVLLGLLVASAIGTAIGSGSILLGGAILLGGGLISYLLFVRQFTWQLALLFCFLDLNFEPGFSFGGFELCFLLGFGAFVAQIWQKREDTVHPFFRTNAFLFFRAALFLWMLYAIGRFVWNYLLPINPNEYALGNAIKSEFSVTGLILLMWLFSFRPRDIIVKRGFANVVAVLLLIGLYLNIAIRLYGIKQGLFAEDTPDNVETALFIPLLNLTENPYSLRLLAPAAVLYGVIFLTSPRIRPTMTGRMRLVYYALLLGGFFGATLSGGRATMLLAGGFLILILVIRRKFAAMACLGILAFIGFCLLNAFSKQIITDPDLALVQRSFYWAMMDRPQWAGESIDASTQWRQDLYYRAIDEWKSDPMIYWFGRGTYKYTDEDRVALERDKWDGAMEISLRRGNTHNLISDLLVIYGLVGLILYFVLCIALIRLCFKFVAYRKLPKDVTDLGIVAALTAVYMVLYGVSAGGGFLIDYLVWFVLIILARIAESAFESTKGTEEAPGLRISQALAH
jgi:O-antigen ligase